VTPVFWPAVDQDAIDIHHQCLNRHGPSVKQYGGQESAGPATFGAIISRPNRGSAMVHREENAMVIFPDGDRALCGLRRVGARDSRADAPLHAFSAGMLGDVR
jgi:hypothetical protein